MKIKIIMMLMLVVLVSHSQNTVINGIVLDDQNEVLTGANVTFKNTIKGTTTDQDGKFSIDVLKFPQIINISFVGFESKEIVISENKFLEVKLSSSISINEVEIVSKVNTTEFSLISPVQTQKISRDELQKAACCNLSESFETNATIDVTFSDAISGAKQIKMLGLDGIYTQITQENLPLIRGISTAFGLTHTPGTWIESIQVIKGAGSVVNGFESFTGQINVNYQSAEFADKLFWNSYVNSEGKIENNLQLAKKNGKWKSNLFLSYQYHNKEVDNNNDDFLDVPHLNSVNILNKWNSITKNRNLTFSVRTILEEREGGQLKAIADPFLVKIDNQLFELSGKVGFLDKDEVNKSIGTQYSFKKHNQFAQFGSNIYDGSQESIFFNIIRQSYYRTTDHTLKYGFSFFGDRYQESINSQILDRTDLISGAFSEYTYMSNNDFVVTAGFRSDYHNKFGFNYLPRINTRYCINDNTIIRFSLGKSFRISNPISENLPFLASSRTISINDNLKPEQAWSYGFNITQLFNLFDREAVFNADFYRTDFTNQIVVDIEKQDQLNFDNLIGDSYSNSLQFDLSYELIERVDFKLAYKINRVYSTFENELKLVPLTPKDRFLVNLAYSTNHLRKWMFDFTLNRIGQSRLPTHNLIDKEFSDAFIQLNSQITKKYNKFDIYLGIENALDYKQENPILSSENPNSPNFDASIIWAPIMGRLIYTGFRFKL